MKIRDTRYKFARKSVRRIQVSTRRKVTRTYPVLFIDIPDFVLSDKKVETSLSVRERIYIRLGIGRYVRMHRCTYKFQTARRCTDGTRATPVKFQGRAGGGKGEEKEAEESRIESEESSKSEWLTRRWIALRKIPITRSATQYWLT